MIDQPISPELIARLKARAEDPERRSDASALAAGSVGLDSLLAGLGPIEDPGIKAHVDHAQGLLTNMMAMLGGGPSGFAVVGPGIGGVVASASFGGTPLAPAPTAPACSEEAVRKAEAALGFTLPEALRQLYLEIGDGGFGPGDGLYSLDRLVARYREMTSEPVGPQGQAWPARLLPVSGADWDLVSIDRDSGRLVFWDLEALADEDEEDEDDRRFDASFRPEADSLGAWLAGWADAPTQAERMQAEREQWTAQAPMSDEAIEQFYRDNPEWAERAEIAAMTDDERVALGYPRVGWEAILWSDDWKPRR